MVLLILIPNVYVVGYLQIQATGACLIVEIGVLCLFYGHTLLFLENVPARRKLVGVVCTVYTIIMHGLLALV